MLEGTISHCCFYCCLLLCSMFSEMYPDVVTPLQKPPVGVIRICKPYICTQPKQRLYLSLGLLLKGLSQVWFHLKKCPESILCFLCVCRDKRLPPPLLSEKSVSVEQLLWPLLSADWQVQWLVTGKVTLRCGQWQGRRAGKDRRELPRQPPLNEFVHGMRPDNSYITLRERCGRGSRPGSTYRGFFQRPLIYLYPMCFICQVEF